MSYPFVGYKLTYSQNWTSGSTPKGTNGGGDYSFLRMIDRIVAWAKQLFVNLQIQSTSPQIKTISARIVVTHQGNASQSTPTVLIQPPREEGTNQDSPQTNKGPDIASWILDICKTPEPIPDEHPELIPSAGQANTLFVQNPIDQETEQFRGRERAILYLA